MTLAVCKRVALKHAKPWKQDEVDQFKDLFKEDNKIGPTEEKKQRFVGNCQDESWVPPPET